LIFCSLILKSINSEETTEANDDNNETTQANDYPTTSTSSPTSKPDHKGERVTSTTTTTTTTTTVNRKRSQTSSTSTHSLHSGAASKPRLVEPRTRKFQKANPLKGKTYKVARLEVELLNLENSGSRLMESLWARP
jgi:hypothetical protein